ncbi:hypothetical protein AB0O67_24105 [Streptomyces sp. NPDC086077]|uniref:hypothetical protein n=1 Tax=Streptomyces sp. NPDC086077 TaxID=3154862 RepID=UPI0034311FC2
MDTGGIALAGACAGVLGAAVGAAGAIFSAIISGRNQSRAQHSHWRRQVRRDAYKDLLRVANAVRRELAPRSSALRQDARLPGTLDTSQLMAELWDVSITVQLEGPARAAVVARELAYALGDWNGAVLMQHYAGEFQQHHPELEALPSDLMALKEEVEQLLTNFTLVARDALDEGDEVRPGR